MFEPAVTEAVLKRFNLPQLSTFRGNPHVWATDDTEYPWYEFFYGGTNRLVVLKYEDDKWEEIRIEDIPYGHLYVLLWKWTMKCKEECYN